MQGLTLSSDKWNNKRLLSPPLRWAKEGRYLGEKVWTKGSVCAPSKGQRWLCGSGAAVISESRANSGREALCLAVHLTNPWSAYLLWRVYLRLDWAASHSYLLIQMQLTSASVILHRACVECGCYSDTSFVSKPCLLSNRWPSSPSI